MPTDNKIMENRSSATRESYALISELRFMGSEPERLVLEHWRQPTIGAAIHGRDTARLIKYCGAGGWKPLGVYRL